MARTRLLVIELLGSTRALSPLLEPRLLADICMLALFGGGRERSEGQFRALLAAAGFRLVRVVPTSGLLCVLEAAPV